MDKKVSREHVLNILRKLTPILLEKYGVTKVGIFGSIAREQASEESDVDIVFQIKKPNLFIKVHIKNELEKGDFKGTMIFCHTGGVFGLFPFRKDIRELF